MVDNPLFYRNITILNSDKHSGTKVVTDATRFSFAAGAHIIPAVIDEFVSGGRALPIVFIPGAIRATPVFLVGLSPGHNAFVDDDGRWLADYVPAFMRRYPFIVGEVANASPLICIDDSSGLLSETHGEDLFTSDGGRTPLLERTALFVGEYMAAAKRTEEFVDLMQKLDLFRTITIDVRSATDESRTLHGTMTIDPIKLDALSEADFMSLRGTALAPIFAHLSSLQNIDKVANAQGIKTKAKHSNASNAEVAPTKQAGSENVKRQSKSV